MHIFRDHNKEVDLWARFGAKECAIDWTSVTEICGFWDGSCNDKVCGTGITMSFFMQGLGWVIRYKKCEPVQGSNSLGAELGGCAMLIESLKLWLQKRKVVLRWLRFNSIQLQFDFIPVRTSCVSARLLAILQYTACIFRWISQAWMGVYFDKTPHPCLAQNVSCGSAGSCSTCHGEGLSLQSVFDCWERRNQFSYKTPEGPHLHEGSRGRICSPLFVSGTSWYNYV